MLSRLLKMIVCQRFFLVKEYSVKRSIFINLSVYKGLSVWTSVLCFPSFLSTVAQSSKSGSFSYLPWDPPSSIEASGRRGIFPLLNLPRDCRLIYNKYYSETWLLRIWTFSQIVVLTLQKHTWQRSCWIRLNLMQYWGSCRRMLFPCLVRLIQTLSVYTGALVSVLLRVCIVILNLSNWAVLSW